MSNIIWDFDGTIADSLPVVIDIYYEWSGREPFSPTQIETMRNLPLKQVLTELDMPLWKVPSLMVKGRTVFGKKLNKVPMFIGIAEVLQGLHKKGHKQFVMSSNSSQNISKFLKTNKIDKYFDGIYGNTGIFGKAAAMKFILKKNKIKASNTYSIGDETRDIDSAKKSDIKSIAVLWGYNGQKIIKQHNPDYMVTKPAEILKLII